MSAVWGSNLSTFLHTRLGRKFKYAPTERSGKKKSTKFRNSDKHQHVKQLQIYISELNNTTKVHTYTGYRDNIETNSTVRQWCT